MLTWFIQSTAVGLCCNFADMEALADLLFEMTARVDPRYLKTGQHNAAVGTVLDLGPMLADATAAC